MRNRESDNSSGFSLIELIIVIVVIGILAAIAFFLFGDTEEDARQSALESAAISAVAPAQNGVMSGLSRSQVNNGPLLDMSTAVPSGDSDEGIFLALDQEYFVSGDQDSVCVRADWIGDSEQSAIAGPGCPGSDDEGDSSDPGDEGGIDTSGEFHVEWSIDSAGQTLELPIDGSIDVTVDWGDGETTESQGVAPSHVYSAPGSYDVEIEGSFKRWDDLEGQGVNVGLIGVSRWDEGVGITTAEGMFSYAEDLEYVTTPPSNITNMNSMFFRAYSFNHDISDWDVSNVASMNGMFHNAESFNQDIGSWDMSSVEDTGGMFWNASTFNQDVSDWDVYSVTDMNSMFNSAPDFNNGGQPLDWEEKTSNVVDMNHMFRSASSFNQDIENWDVSSVKDMSSMFRLSPFNQSIEGWNLESIESMNHMFWKSSFNQPLGSWDVSNAVFMNNMFWGASSFNQDVSDWDVSNVTTMESMFNDASDFNNGGEPLDWVDKIGSVTTMNKMFNQATSFNQDISDWDVSGISGESFALNSALDHNKNPFL